MNAKLRGVEASRGMAALLVVMLHATDILKGPGYFGRPAFGGVFAFGHAGVDFFFVLSGFIITFVHRRDIGRPGQLAAFAWKRVMRVFPVYWIATLSLLVLMFISPTADGREYDIPYVVGSLFLVPWVSDPLLGPGWTLRHEMLFYGVFALLVIDRRLGAAAMAAWLIGLALNIAAITATGTPYFDGVLGDLVFRQFNVEFFLGIGVACVIGGGFARYPRAACALGLLVFAAAAAADDAWGGAWIPVEWPPLHLGYALGSALILYGLAAGERAGRLAPPAFLVTLGAASYSLYLLHVLIVMVGAFGLRLARPWIAVPLPVEFILLTASCASGSIVFSRAVEQPMLRYLRRLPLAPRARMRPAE